MRFLLRPGWLAFVALVVGFAVACYTLLAPWQFGRQEQRDAQERAIAASDAAAPVPLAALVPAGAGVTPELEWRRVVLTGTYLPGAEAAVRLRVFDGDPAVEVLTPMRLTDGRTVVVDRGYSKVAGGRAVPAPPPPPAGPVTVTARLRTNETDPQGRPPVRSAGPPQIYAVDSRSVAALSGLPLVSGVLQLTPDQPGVLAPVEVTPTVANDAPFTNYSYALQWLTFGLIALVALGYFIRLEVLQRRGDDAPRVGRRSARAEMRRALAGDDEPEVPEPGTTDAGTGPGSRRAD